MELLQKNQKPKKSKMEPPPKRRRSDSQQAEPKVFKKSKPSANPTEPFSLQPPSSFQLSEKLFKNVLNSSIVIMIDIGRRRL
jgi:hypothetical protein